jgi:hypothetical protein
VLHSGNRREIARADSVVTSAIVAGAIAVAALNALPAALGAWLWFGEPVAPGRPSVLAARAFWVLVRIGQGSALTFAIAVGSLAAAGKEPSESLFYVYALLPLAIALLAEQLRVTSAQAVLDQRGLADSAAVGRLAQEEQHAVVAAILRREVGVMALSAAVVVVLALRAAGTAQGF